jgi:hypothetical protein
LKSFCLSLQGVLNDNLVNIFVLFFLLILSIHTYSDAAVYEASTLYNAVSRSQTVQDLFAERCKAILDKALYVDVYAKINWLYSFKINEWCPNSGDST